MYNIQHVALTRMVLIWPNNYSNRGELQSKLRIDQYCDIWSHLRPDQGSLMSRCRDLRSKLCDKYPSIVHVIILEMGSWLILWFGFDNSILSSPRVSFAGVSLGVIMQNWLRPSLCYLLCCSNGHTAEESKGCSRKGCYAVAVSVTAGPICLVY